MCTAGQRVSLTITGPGPSFIHGFNQYVTNHGFLINIKGCLLPLFLSVWCKTGALRFRGDITIIFQVVQVLRWCKTDATIVLSLACVKPVSWRYLYTAYIYPNGRFSLRCNYGANCVVVSGEPSCECPMCSEEFNPVCGSDGYSYTNECKLRYNALRHPPISKFRR